MPTKNTQDVSTDLETLHHALQQCEKRFQYIVGLTSEYYWEQDKEFRFTLFKGAAIDEQSARLQAALGKTRWELGGTPLVDEGRWDRHQALLAEGKSFQDFRYMRDDPIQGRIYLSTSGQPIFSSEGHLLGYCGITRDITRVVREERLLTLGNKVTRILAETEDIPQALQAAIAAICETEGWIAGQFWKIDPAAGILRLELGWSNEERNASSGPSPADLSVVFTQGAGLPGWVWQHARPLWIPDTGRDSRALYPDLLSRRNWKAAFLIPVTSAGEVIGVLGFYAPAIPEPDERLLQVTSIVGAEIGHFHQNSLALAKLRESEALFHDTVDLAAVCIAHVGQDDSITKVNQATCKLLGYTEAELLGKTFRNLTHPEDKEVTTTLRDRVWAGELDSFRSEKRYLHKDGHTIWVGIASSIKRGRAGEPKYAIVVFEDITARKEAEQALQESEARFRSLIDLTSDGYWEQDAELRFSHFAGQNEERLESLRNRFLGKRNWETNIRVEAEGGWDKMKAVMEARQPFRDVITSTILPDGSQRFTSISGEPIFDRDGRFTGYRGLSRDVTTQKQAEEHIRHLATHDRLTNLPNREMLSQLINNAIQTSRRYNRRFAILFIDLDGFKQVNDTLGHKVGDELLIEMTERLKKILRASDVIARLGGDEFVVLVQEIIEENQVAIIANNILSAVKKPMVSMNQEYGVTASIGICIYSSESQDEQTMMKHADIAMYLAKERGKNNYQFYSGATRNG